MKKNLPIRRFCFLFFFLCSIVFAGAQTIPELTFQNPVLVSGTAGTDGAEYRFYNVGPNLDAVIKITGRSSASVVLGNIDTVEAGIGYVKSFQPVIGIPGTAPANTTWWMKFNCAFYEANTTHKVKMSVFNVTGLDIDGDAVTTYEWQEMERIDKIDTSLVNNLTFSMLQHHGDGDDYRITGIIANSPGIDTSALNVMATYTFKNQDNFNFTIGATTTASTTSAGMRLNSLWFKQFSTSNLPMKLLSFSTVLNNSQAELTWKTVSEIGVSYFEIEKSKDGVNFSTAGIVSAKGNEADITTYYFSNPVDVNQDKVIYYRLRSVDADGKSQYSETRMIRLSKGSATTISIDAFPNPATSEVRICIPNEWQNKKVMYEILNCNGQSVQRKEIASSSQTESMNTSDLSKGFYVVRVNCEGQSTQQKIIKQ